MSYIADSFNQFDNSLGKKKIWLRTNNVIFNYETKLFPNAQIITYHCHNLGEYGERKIVDFTDDDLTCGIYLQYHNALVAILNDKEIGEKACWIISNIADDKI